MVGSFLGESSSLSSAPWLGSSSSVLSVGVKTAEGCEDVN